MTKRERSLRPAGPESNPKGREGRRLSPGAHCIFLAAVLGAVCGCASRPPLDLGEVHRAYSAPAPEVTEGLALAEREAGKEQEELFGTQVKELALQEVLRYALAHNPRIRAAQLRVLSAQARERASGYLPDPRVGWTWAVEEIQTRNGPVEHVLSLTQQFPYWGKLAAERELFKARAAAERELLLAAELSVIQEVQKAYFAVFLTQQEIAINQRTSAILKRFVRVAQRKVAAGKGTQVDILLAETELLRLENERVDLDQRLETEKAYLNTLLDRKPGAYLPPVGVPKPVYRAQLDGLIAWALENLPDLRHVRKVIEQNRSLLRLAHLRYVPDLTAGLSYSVVGSSPVKAGAVKSGRDAVSGMVGINLPLWIPKYEAQVQAAKRALEASQAALRDTELFSVYRIVELHLRVETALRHVELFGGEILPKARQVLQVLESGYTAGTVDFLKLLDAERTLERFELEYQRALAEFEMRLADLSRAVGKPLREEQRK